MPSWSTFQEIARGVVRNVRRLTVHPWGRAALGWAAAVVCLMLALRNVDLQGVWWALIQVDPGWLLAITLISMATYLATARRWQLLFPDAEAPSVHDLFKALMVAQLVNSGLPGRLGILSRAYSVSRRGTVSAFFVLCTVLIEKVLEGVSLVPFAVVVLFLLALPEQVSHSLRLASSVAVVAGVGVACLLVAGRLGLRLGVSDKLARGSEKSRSKTPSQGGLGPFDAPGAGVGAALRRFLGRFRAFRRFGEAFVAIQTTLDPKCWPRLWGWSLLIWLAIIGMNYLALLALEIQVPFLAAVALLVVLQLGGRIPAPVAGIGVFHYLAVVTLSLFGVSKETALGFGVLMHAVTYLPPSLMGAWYLWRGDGGRLDLSATRVLTEELL